MSLRAKLFLTLLLTATLAVVGTQVFVRWSFFNGLKHLAEARERRAIELVGNRLIDVYQSDGDWEGLRSNPREWARLWRDPERLAPNHWHPRTEPRDDLDEDHPPSPPRRALRPLLQRILLQDASGELVAGYRQDDSPALMPETTRFPLELNGKRIGVLLLLPGPALGDAAQRLFQREQNQRLWIIALAMVVLTALLAFPAAALLSRPLLALQRTARRLADGDYQARAPLVARDELGRLADDLNTLAKTLSHNQEARRRWVADISHELRTPLGLLRAEIEALRDGVRRIDAATLAHLHEAVLRLGRLVDDLYELTRTEPGTLTYRFAPVDAVQLLQSLMDSLRGSFADRKLELELVCDDAGPWILQADADRLRQLLGNLLHNSLTYTDSGGQVRVRLARKEAGLLVQVDDSPPGVPAQALPMLFERLYRVEHSRNRAAGGAGLGLAIAHNIVTSHGGAIRAEHSPLGGLRILIELPLRAEAPSDDAGHQS